MQKMLDPHEELHLNVNQIPEVHEMQRPCQHPPAVTEECQFVL